MINKTEYKADTISSERIAYAADNEEALLWRLRMIAAAKESIVLTTFDLREDNSGTDVMVALYDAAERGVKVQLLVDGVCAFTYLSGSGPFQALAAHENAQVRIYNPVSPPNLHKLNYRMHDKYLIIDESMYSLGGRNTNDLFLGSHSEKSKIDREILVYETVPGAGESLQDLQEYFCRVWNEPCVKERSAKMNVKKQEEYDRMFLQRYETLKQIYGDFTAYTNWMADTYEVNKITFLSNGTQAVNKPPQMLYAIGQLAVQGSDVLIQTPYLVANRDMYRVLEEISSVADLKIILNAVEIGPNPFGCADYLNQKTQILHTGAEIYELINERAVHTKTVVIDDDLSVVGSFNYDMRSTYLDTELMLVIDSEELNAHLREMADEYAKKSMRVLLDGTEIAGVSYREKGIPIVSKIVYGFLRVIIIPFRYML